MSPNGLPWTQPNLPREPQKDNRTGRRAKPGRAARASPPRLHLVVNVTLPPPPHPRITWAPLFCKCPHEPIILGLNATFNSVTASRSPLGLVAEAAVAARASHSLLASSGRRVGAVGGGFCNINISILRIRSLLNYSQNGFPHPSPKQTTGHPDEPFLHIFRKKIK